MTEADASKGPALSRWTVGFWRDKLTDPSPGSACPYPNSDMAKLS